MEVVAMIDCNGMDIVIQHDLGDEVVRRALAATFLVPEGRISIIDDVGDYPRSGDFDVVCVSSQVEGEFARLLSIQSNHVALPYETRAQLTQALCEHLGIQYITPDDDDADPSRSERHLPRGRAQRERRAPEGGEKTPRSGGGGSRTLENNP
jgi:hypothetical protein